MNHQHLLTQRVFLSPPWEKCLWENLGLWKQSIISIETHFKEARQNTALKNTSNRLDVRITGCTPTSDKYLLHKPGKSWTNCMFVSICLHMWPAGTSSMHIFCLKRAGRTTNEIHCNIQNHQLVTIEKIYLPIFLLRASAVPLWQTGTPAGTSLPSSQLEKCDWNHVYRVRAKKVRNTSGREKVDS